MLLKLFDANELLNSVKIENMSLLEKVKSLELELSVTREQIDITSTSKLDEMLLVQKYVPNKTGIGFIENGSTTVVNPPKFIPTTSSSVVRQKSEFKKSNKSGSKKNHKPLWFCHFCGRARHIRPNCFKVQALKKSPKQKVHVPEAQDLVALIYELVNVLNLYTNTGVEIKTNPISWFASKRDWMQKTQPQ